MSATQNRDSISGWFTLRGFRPDDVSGSVSPDGTLSFTGTVRDSFNIQLQDVRFEPPQNRQTTGSFEEVYSNDTTSFSGTARIVSRLRRMTRVSEG